MLLKAALNGARPAPLIPTDPNEVAQSAVGVVRCGAKALHVHPRNARHEESFSPDCVAATLNAVKNACPGIPVGISSGAWIEPNLENRLRLMKDWVVLPDFISVNFDEDGAHLVADLMLKRGIAVEAGLNGPAAANNFVAYPQNCEVLRVLLEPQEQSLDEVLRNVSLIERAIDGIELPQPYLLHGFESVAWKVFEYAVAHGYNVRMGFEDTFTLSSGVSAKSNSELIAAASALVSSAVAT